MQDCFNSGEEDNYGQGPSSGERSAARAYTRKRYGSNADFSNQVTLRTFLDQDLRLLCLGRRALWGNIMNENVLHINEKALFVTSSPVLLLRCVMIQRALDQTLTQKQNGLRMRKRTMIWLILITTMVL